MAEQQADTPAEEPQGDPGAGPKKKKVVLIGGLAAVVAGAFLTALLAIPKKQEHMEFEGPFVAPLTAQKVQVNLSKSKSFLILDMNIRYEAYSEAYFAARSADPLTVAEIKDALVELASAKTRAEVTDRVNKPVFMEEIRHAVDPLIFPVHLGNAKRPYEPDSESGVRPGLSSHQADFRGAFEDHRLSIDAVKHTLSLDGGPQVQFSGEETDLEVVGPNEERLYVDVTGLEEEFVGEIKVGVKGRVRRVLWNEVLIQ